MGGFTDRLRSASAALYGIVLLGGGLRLYNLGAESLWLDEAASLSLIAGRTLPEILIEIPQTDRHPPLYYAILKLWTDQFGTAEVVTRFPSAVFGIAAIPVAYALGARLYDRRVGLLAAGLLALSQFHINAAQGTRMYGLFALLSLTSFYWLVRLVETPTRRVTGWYIGTTILLVYTHAFALFLVLAQTLFVAGSAAVSSERKPAVSWRRWVGAQLVIGVIALPWIGALLRQALLTEGRPPGLGWIPDPTVSRIIATPGAYISPSDPLLGMAAIIVVCALIVVERGIDASTGTERSGTGDHAATADEALSSPERRLLLWTWVLVPIVVPAILSYLVDPIFIYRYTMGAAMGAVLLIAAGVLTLRAAELRYVAVGVLVLGLVTGLPAYYAQPQHEQWRAVASDLDGEVGANDTVLVTEPTYKNPLNHYASGNGFHATGLQDTASNTSIRRAVGTNGTVWLVVAKADPAEVDRFQRVVGETRTQTNRTRYVGATVIEFEDRSTSDGERR